MSQQQLYRPPDLLKDTEADVARWLAAQEPEEAIGYLARVTKRLPITAEQLSQKFSRLIVLWTVVFSAGFLVDLRVLIISLVVLPIGIVFYLVSTRQRTLTNQRYKWLRQQLTAQLERGGRTVSLSAWITGVGALHEERRRSYDALAHRLATATSDELNVLTQDERAALRELLKEWPGEALQIALLLALGTAGDIFVKPYARRLVTNPDESETVREAAEECLCALDAAATKL
jgi:hypothetical protein